ncbi:MAG TPA: hypothetical protein VGI05_26680 [Streptosporangiaceae bacterium]|jgi:hypothetical protein
MTTTTEPGGAFAPLGGLLEMVDMHAAGSDLTREEAVADLVVAGIFRFYGPAGFPQSRINPGGYDRTELARSRGSQPPGSGLEPELASSVPEPPGSGELDRLRAEQQRQMRDGPAPASPCDACGGDPTGDASWASPARASREALSLLGWPIVARCLPGEEHECGHGFAGHTLAHLATIIGVCNHQLIHLGADEDTTASEIIGHTMREMDRRDARPLQLTGGVLRGGPGVARPRPPGQPQG